MGNLKKKRVGEVGLIFLAAILVSACATSVYSPSDDMSKFYADKLHCESIYTQGFNILGSKIYGDVTKEGPAQDCMLAKGYKILKSN